MTPLRVAWRSLNIIIHILLGIVLNTLVSRRDKETGLYKHNRNLISWWYARLCKILHLEIRHSGPLPPNGSLMIANHISWLDIPVLGSLTHTDFLAKDEIRNWPLVGWMTATSGSLFIKRGAGQSDAVKAAIITRLHAGSIMTIFPEGKTTDGREVRPFFSRLFAVVLETGTPLIPVALRYRMAGEIDMIAPYIDHQSLIENLMSLLKRKESEVIVTFCPALDYQGKDRKNISEMARSTITNALEQIDGQENQRSPT